MAGAVIVRGPRVLAARRIAPASARGGWEFPGGKVEAGESLRQALEREIAEELGCRVRVVATLRGEQRIDEGHVLRLAHAQLVAGEPVPLEHDAVRWLSAPRLRTVRWLPADLPFLNSVHALLTGPR